MQSISLFNIGTQYVPEFTIATAFIILITDGKRYLSFRDITNFIKFLLTIFSMIVISYFVRQFAFCIIDSFLLQTAAFTALFKLLYFRNKSIKRVSWGIFKYLLIQMAAEIILAACPMLFIGATLKKMLSDDMLNLYLSIPVRVMLVLLFIICWNWKGVSFIREYKEVKTLSLIVETLLLIAEILCIYEYLGFSVNGVLAQKIVAAMLLLLLSIINVLYLYSLNLLGKGIYNKIYPKVIELREGANKSE